jgi:hypothetical protein
VDDPAYQALSAADRKAFLSDRLRALELEHFAHTLALAVLDADITASPASERTGLETQKAQMTKGVASVARALAVARERHAEVVAEIVAEDTPAEDAPPEGTGAAA